MNLIQERVCGPHPSPPAAFIAEGGGGRQQTTQITTDVGFS